MKKIALVVLASGLLSAPPRAAAQATAASAVPAAPAAPAASPAVAPDTCPCADYRFAPKTDKAKAVAAFWVARRRYKVASGFGSALFLFALGTGDSRALDVQRSMSLALHELLKARALAVQLEGLKVVGNGGPEASVVVSLKQGVDYDLPEPR